MHAALPKPISCYILATSFTENLKLIIGQQKRSLQLKMHNKLFCGRALPERTAGELTVLSKFSSCIKRVGFLGGGGRRSREKGREGKGKRIGGDGRGGFCLG